MYLMNKPCHIRVVFMFAANWRCRLFDTKSGQLIWPIHARGYEIVEWDDDVAVPRADLGAVFYRSELQDKYLRKRGVIRAKGEELNEYTPMQDAVSLARRIADLYVIDPLINSPTDAGILGFTQKFGLLIPGNCMAVADFVQTSKYLHIFARALDRGEKNELRNIFNETIVPGMTVRLVGSASGKPTAMWNLEVEPLNLIAAAWLQLAMELTNGKPLKKCEAPGCLEWFSYRSNKRFCDNRCKLAFHRSSK